MAPARKSLADRAASGAVWVFAQTWGNQIARFAVFLVLARILGPEAFGVLTLALVVTALGERLTVEGGWSKGLIRKPQLDPADLDSVFWLLMAISGVFVCLAFVFANPVADWFEEPEVALILPWIASVLPLHALNVVPQAILERNFNFRDLALVSLISTLCGGLTGVALALAGAGIWSLVFYQIAQTLIRTMLLWRVCRWRPGRRIDWTSLKDILGFATGVLTDRVARAMDFIVGRALIGYNMSTSSLGYYGFAHEFLGLNRRLLVAPLTRVALPAIAGLHFHPERLRPALISGIQYLALVAFPAPIGLAIVAPDLVPLLVGSHWTPAVPAVQIAMLLGPIVPLMRLSITLQLAIGRVRSVAGLAVLSTSLFIVLLLLPQYLTVETVLIALVVRSYLVFPLHLALMQRLTGISMIRVLRALTPLLASCFVMAVAVLAVRAVLPTDVAPLWRLSASITAGIIAYVAALSGTARPLLSQSVRLAVVALGTTLRDVRAFRPRRHQHRELTP